MKTILGIVRPRQGSVHFAGERIDGLSTQAIVRRGIALVPEARRLFGRMTVRENLMMGAFTRRSDTRRPRSMRIWSGSSACSRA